MCEKLHLKSQGKYEPVHEVAAKIAVAQLSGWHSLRIVGRRPWQPSSQPCLIVPLGRWETLNTRFILALEDDSPFWNKLDWQENKPLSKWKTFSYECIVSRADSFLHTDTLGQLVLGNGLCAYLQQKSRQALCIGILLYFFLHLSTWQHE